MKNKTNIKEMDASVTSSVTPPTTSSTSSGSGNMTVDTKALKKPEVVNAIDKLKRSKVNVKVVEESGEKMVKKLEYLSEIKDADSGEISKPFTIGDKSYQMVRVMTPDKKNGVGVYSLDEVDESGENIIYDVKEFEENIANKFTQKEEKVEVETDTTEDEVSDKTEVNDAPKDEEGVKSSFAGFKHFIVNKKTGKSRKFKTIEELAKAKMAEDEQYMGIKDFKKFVDETLFGPSKRQPIGEIDDLSGTETDEEMNVKAKKLMDLIRAKIPERIFKTIKTPIAQREVISAFSEMIGVPRNGLSGLLSGLKDLSKKEEITERRIIKIKDLNNAL